MPGSDDERGSEAAHTRSGFAAFWTSLPGVLTSIAALITAVATLAALDLGEGDDGSDAPSAVAPRSTQPAASPEPSGGPARDQPGCFAEYFSGVPSDRIEQVEEGTSDFDIIDAGQPKAGTIGMRFTSTNQPVGGMRIAFFPANALFKIESIADERCRVIEDYENISRGGNKRVLQNWDTVRMELGGSFYDLRIGESTTIRLNFQAYAP